MDVNNNPEITILPYDEANFPDVAISESNEIGVASVFYTMLLFGDDKWIVCTHDYEELLTSNIVSTPNIEIAEENDPFGLQVFRPRIAAPGLIDGYALDPNFWSVAAQAYDHINSESHIFGITRSGSPFNIFKHGYTDNGSDICEGAVFSH